MTFKCPLFLNQVHAWFLEITLLVCLCVYKSDLLSLHLLLSYQLHLFLMQDVPHLNDYIYDKHLMKSFHEANTDDDSDLFYPAAANKEEGLTMVMCH